MATRQREKAAKIEATRDKRPTAIAYNIRITADKVGIVLDLVRGKDLDKAIAILNYTNKSASPVILKLVNSAAANAENNLNIAKDNLFVAECWAGPGPTMKRMMPRARGRADRILKHTCNITVILDEKKVEVKKPAKKEPTVKKEQAPKVKTPAESPVAKTPNAKKPLGEKKAPAVKTAPVKTSKPVAKVSTKATQVKKGGK